MSGGRADHDSRIASMFDEIATDYDRLNRTLSFGTDLWWRRRAIALAGDRPWKIAADVGAGTGDLSLGLLARSADGVVVGVDLSSGMLGRARHRAASSRGGDRFHACLASAEAMPFADASVDLVVSGFTLRNVDDLSRALSDIRRVLRPGGQAVLLELSHPPQPLFGLAYRLYFERVLPVVAALLGGDHEAYRYLPRSLRPFPGAPRLAALMRDAGFRSVRFVRLTFGIAAIHVGEK